MVILLPGNGSTALSRRITVHAHNFNSDGARERGSRI